MTERASPEGLGALEEILANLGKTKPYAVGRLLESGAALLYALRGQALESDYQGVAKALLERMRGDDVRDRTRLVVARRLGRAFGIPVPHATTRISSGASSSLPG